MTDAGLPDARHWPLLSVRDGTEDARVPRDRATAHRLTLQIRQMLKAAPYFLAEGAEYKILALFRHDP